MSPRAWIMLFILSVTVSGEALIWALANGQFHNVERGRYLPLRPANSPLNARRRHPVRVAIYMLGLAAVALVCLWAVGGVLVEATVMQP